MLLSRVTGLTLVLALLGGIVASAVAQQAPPPPPALPLAVPAQPAASDELFKVPDGTPEELSAYLDKLKDVQAPPQNQPDQFRAYLSKLCPAFVEAGDKILTGKPKPTEAQATKGFQAKIQGLMGMKMIGAPGIDQKIEQLPEQMKQLGFPKLEQAAKMILVQWEVGQALREQDVPKVEAAISKAVKMLEAQPVAPQFLQFIQQLGQISQMIDKPTLVVPLYEKYGKALSENANPQAQEAGKRMLGSVNRLTSVGKPIELEGVFLDGTKLDWKKQFDGKVVLVTFWASWCGPCRQEMEHLMKLYPYYHPKGFDVLGINLDDEKSTAEGFVKENKLPWPTLVSGVEGKTGFNDPNAVRYGISGIPSVMVVGKDGKITALGVRGPKLDAMLADLFGPLPGGGEALPAGGDAEAKPPAPAR